MNNFTQQGRLSQNWFEEDNEQKKHWNEAQQTCFVWFLLMNQKDIYQKESNRVKKRLFALMSQFIPSRKPSQCRTHFYRKIKEKEDNGDVRIFLCKKLSSCFCCQKDLFLNIKENVIKYLQTKNINNQLFYEKVKEIDQNIREIQQLKKKKLQIKKLFLQKKFKEQQAVTNFEKKSFKPYQEDKINLQKQDQLNIQKENKQKCQFIFQDE